jgi:hypothetical protein
MSRCHFVHKRKFPHGLAWDRTWVSVARSMYVTVTLTLILLMWRIGWAPSSIPIYIQQDATLHSLFIYGNCSTCFGWYFHHRERIQLYVQNLVFVTPLLLSAAIVEELEPVWVCCGWRTPPTGWWFIWIVRWCTDLQTWTFTFKF